MYFNVSAYNEKLVKSALPYWSGSTFSSAVLGLIIRKYPLRVAPIVPDRLKILPTKFASLSEISKS